MKCPYRMNEVHTCHNGKTWVYREFAECYCKLCPYFDAYSMGSCRKVANEIGCYASREVE